jgi:predicted transcriptional regulator
MAEPVSADVLRAVSDPVRLAMLVALETDALTVPQLAERVGVAGPEVAAQLETLRATGLVVDGGDAGAVRAAAQGWAEILEHLRRLQDPGSKGG